MQSVIFCKRRKKMENKYIKGGIRLQAIFAIQNWPIYFDLLNLLSIDIYQINMQHNKSKVRVEVGVSNTFLIDKNKVKMILCLLVSYRLYQNKWQYSLIFLAEWIPWSMDPLCKIKDILNIIVQRVIEIWMKLHNLQSGKNTLIVE